MEFNEYIIKRKKGPREIAISIGIYILATGLAFTCLAFLIVIPQIAALAGFGCYYLAHRISTGLNKEFEYIFTSDSITIDVIMNASRRKRVLSFNASQLEIMAPVKHHSYDIHKNEVFHKNIDATSGSSIMVVYYAIYNDGDNRYMVRFEPPYSFVKEFYKYAPSKVILDE